MLRNLARRSLQTMVAVLAVAGAGYVSSMVTRARCETFGMQQIVDAVRLPDGTTVPVFLLPDHSPRARAALQRVGLSVQPCLDSPEKFACFPWADVDSKIVAPFVVAVRWEHVAFPTSGAGGEAVFFCLFGARWPIHERGLWVA